MIKVSMKSTAEGGFRVVWR